MSLHSIISDPEDSVLCPSISVGGASYADCDGVYSVTSYVVLWAVDRPVYKHISKDR